jgi:hypothetical protein
MRDLSRRDFLDVGAGVAALGMFGWPRSAGAQQADTWNPGIVITAVRNHAST